MANHGLFAIENLQDAQDAWKIFFNRFYSPKVPENANVEFDIEQRNFLPRKEKNAKNKSPLDIGGRTDHSDDFDDFLNGYTVRIPDNIELSEIDFDCVKEAILQGDYEASVFKNENHVFYALWLFRQDKISRQQLSTLLAREQIPKDYPIVKTFPILDDRGEFTKDAKKMLISVLKTSRFTKLRNWHLERFRLLIQALPKSERIFYVTECDPKNISIEGVTQLGNDLRNVGSWERTKYKNNLYDLHLSFGAIEARQIALNGVHGAAANRSKIGVISTAEIKEGVADNYRPTAISINNSGVAPTIQNIHHFPVSTRLAVTKHDIYHAQLHNTIPAEFHMAFNHMKQIISNFTKVKSSLLQWTLTDREFPDFKGKSKNFDSKKGAKYFAKILFPKGFVQELPSLFNDYSFHNLSDDGIAIIRDMVNESEKWKNLYKIDINYLDYPYDKAIQQMRAFIKTEKNNAYNAKLFSLKYRIFCDSSEVTYQKISEIINTIENTLTDNLKFENVNYKEFKNRTVLKYNKKEVINRSSALQVVLRSYLISKFKTNSDELDCQFSLLSNEFKSIYDGSQLTNVKIDDVCNNLNSLFDKLTLLEHSYKEIIQTRYSRRHARINCLFFFMKNSLTMSQRKHIAFLKAKMNNLINEHLVKIIDVQEKEQFKWVIENQFKLIHHKDSRINFDSIYDDQTNSLDIPTNLFTSL
ncbi:hypothetical protein [Rickettsiella endosymbiont of Xylota segnis]|uniref:hypothetical protein n=1 Tax=Rickettsiella endosymbiont of Xylota segnis TaxID=3066238 RepID=UPI0030D033D7